MSTSGQSKISVRQALHDRCLTVASPGDATAVLRHLDPKYGGVVFSSSGGFSRGHAVKRMFPGLVIAADHRERGKEESRQRLQSR